MTENDVINLPSNMGSRNTIYMDGMFSHMATVSSAQPNSFNPNNQNQIMAEFPALSMLQGGPLNNLHSGLTVANQVDLADCNSSVPMDSPINGNVEVQERFISGMPISAAPLATLLAVSCGPSDNLNKLDTSLPSVNPPEILRTSISNDLSDASHSPFATFINCGYDGILGGMNNKCDFNKFSACPELTGKIAGRMGLQPLQLVGNVNPSGWISSGNVNMMSDSPPGSSKFCNELALSLATCQPSFIYGTSIPDQCLEINSSGIAHHCLNERQFGLETSCNGKNISVNFGSSGAFQLSQFFSASGYLRVIQEILTEIASYSLENRENFSISSSCPSEDGSFEVQMDLVLQGREVEAKKMQLLALLQVVDERYTQCLDEIHTVISAFHAATELDPRVHARFALQTISSLYKNLRERISSQILTMGAYLDKGDTREEERSFETSFIQKQWALQQLQRKDHQLWRPQRGLPERSVSVLRAWMFQNFLHPYPKDAEKHLLAVKSGLTRSQVSNWFINARVRLWKPMIEEMYAEVNRRKGRRNDKEMGSNRISQVNLDGRRLAMNRQWKEK